MVIEQVLDKQYRIRYGDDQHIKVATKNMVPVMEQGAEVNPVEVTVDTEDTIEEDTTIQDRQPTDIQRDTRYRPGGYRCMVMAR